MASCCTCCGSNPSESKKNLPLLCLVPREDGTLPKGGGPGSSKQRPASAGSTPGFKFLSDDYIKKNFNLPQRALYLDTYRRPLITFPMTQENSNNFNLYRKTKINQQILDGFLDGGESISAPSVFPYAKSNADKEKDAEEDDEIIYILQLPDLESQCPVHNQTIRTPRPLVRPGFDALNITAPVMVQMNPEGQWETSKPDSLDEQKLRAVVRHLVNSRTVSAAQSYCTQCSKDGMKSGAGSNYVPVILMPIYPADQCPFDMDCEIDKIKKKEKEQPKKSTKDLKSSHTTESDESKKKQKKKGFVMQRLTDFDLLSQW